MLIRKAIAGTAMMLLIFGGFLLVPASTLYWWRAWVFIGGVLAGSVVTMATVFRGHEDLFNERMKPIIQKGQPRADKIAVALLVGTIYGLIIFIPVDVFHLHLMRKPVVGVSSLGLALYVFGWTLMSLALRDNAFASAVVKHQEERHQVVVDTGVYSIVRHPMYAGVIPWMVGMPLWLESYAAAVLAIAPLGVLVLRIFIEEAFLRRELPGYTEYTERVRYRLIPFVW
jgi:protein-S-isoprenylcysteine O-methyltransferase Ste14